MARPLLNFFWLLNLSSLVLEAMDRLVPKGVSDRVFSSSSAHLFPLCDKGERDAALLKLASDELRVFVQALFPGEKAFVFFGNSLEVKAAVESFLGGMCGDVYSIAIIQLPVGNHQFSVFLKNRPVRPGDNTVRRVFVDTFNMVGSASKFKRLASNLCDKKELHWGCAPSYEDLSIPALIQAWCDVD